MSAPSGGGVTALASGALFRILLMGTTPRNLFAAVFLFATSTGLAADNPHIPGLTGPKEQILENVTVTDLLQNPEKYHGKRLVVHGYLHVQFENNALYANKEDADYLRTWRAAWVSFSDKITFRKLPFGAPHAVNDPRELNASYVFCEGTFDKDETGHMSIYRGGLSSVSALSQETRTYDGPRRVYNRP